MKYHTIITEVKNFKSRLSHPIQSKTVSESLGDHQRHGLFLIHPFFQLHIVWMSDFNWSFYWRFFFFFFHSLIKSQYVVMVSKLWPTKIPNAPHSLTSFPHWGYMCVCVCVHIRACALSFCFYDSGQWFWVEERELIKDKIIFDLKMTCQLYLDMFVTLFFDILEY